MSLYRQCSEVPEASSSEMLIHNTLAPKPNKIQLTNIAVYFSRACWGFNVPILWTLWDGWDHHDLTSATATLCFVYLWFPVTHAWQLAIRRRRGDSFSYFSRHLQGKQCLVQLQRGETSWCQQPINDYKICGRLKLLPSIFVNDVSEPWFKCTRTKSQRSKVI